LACLMAWATPMKAYDWLPPTNKVAVLAVWAHPDDEGIFGGGSLPYYSAVLNLPTMLLCMTASEGNVRADELRCAAWTYGLRYEPLLGGFTDINSGFITNTPYGTNTINVTWDYWAGVGFLGDGTNVEVGKVRAINYVAEQIRRYRPDVVITHDLNGDTGNDNHKATAYAVTRAFLVAADPTATATNLVGLPPWQVQKLYVHLYPTNRLFHEFWETPYPALTNQTPRQMGHIGLMCHVSQTAFRWNVASVYDPANYYSTWPSEWWGLYASTVGPDTVLSSNLVQNGYTVPSSVAAGNFLEHVSLGPLYQPPAFTVQPLILPSAATYDPYTGPSLANYVVAQFPQTLTFSKISGPDWLSVAPDGTLSGTSSRTDAGTNTWLISMADGVGPPAQVTVSIFLVGRALGKENLVGWWKLNETNPASPVAVNSAPYSPDGVCYGGVTFGQYGARPRTHWAAQFNGTDGKIDVPYSSALNPLVFTTALWANATGGSGTYRSPLTNRKGGPSVGCTFYAGFNDLWQFWIGNGSGWSTLTAGPVVANTWIHLAATYDGTTACFYTNGILAASANVGFQPNDSSPLRIGAGATEGPGAYWFPGLVDDVRVYRVALDAVHIQALYLDPPTVSSLAVQGDGTVLVEGSGIPGQTYVLLASASQFSSTAWAPADTNAADANGQLMFIDPAAVNWPQRFYRLILP
jgi:LmbE family N-acetylglucosaminyl deacetylase